MANESTVQGMSPVQTLAIWVIWVDLAPFDFHLRGNARRVSSVHDLRCATDTLACCRSVFVNDNVRLQSVLRSLALFTTRSIVLIDDPDGTDDPDDGTDDPDN
jgi:hypothetical protein